MAGNFRDFNAAVRRVATLCPGGRIGINAVTEERGRLREGWRRTPRRQKNAVSSRPGGDGLAARSLGEDEAVELDALERAQLDEVLRVCRDAPTPSEASRRLFEVSRTRKETPNDADRLRKYLARFDLEWATLHGQALALPSRARSTLGAESSPMLARSLAGGADIPPRLDVVAVALGRGGRFGLALTSHSWRQEASYVLASTLRSRRHG